MTEPIDSHRSRYTSYESWRAELSCISAQLKRLRNTKIHNAWHRLLKLVHGTPYTSSNPLPDSRQADDDDYYELIARLDRLLLTLRQEKCFAGEHSSPVTRISEAQTLMYRAVVQRELRLTLEKSIEAEPITAGSSSSSSASFWGTSTSAAAAAPPTPPHLRGAERSHDHISGENSSNSRRKKQGSGAYIRSFGQWKACVAQSIRCGRLAEAQDYFSAADIFIEIEAYRTRRNIPTDDGCLLQAIMCTTTACGVLMEDTLRVEECPLPGAVYKEASGAFHWSCAVRPTTGGVRQLVAQEDGPLVPNAYDDAAKEKDGSVDAGPQLGEADFPPTSSCPHVSMVHAALVRLADMLERQFCCYEQATNLFELSAVVLMEGAPGWMWLNAEEEHAPSSTGEEGGKLLPSWMSGVVHPATTNTNNNNSDGATTDAFAMGLFHPQRATATQDEARSPAEPCASGSGSGGDGNAPQGGSIFDVFPPRGTASFCTRVLREYHQREQLQRHASAAPRVSVLSPTTGSIKRNGGAELKSKHITGYLSTVRSVHVQRGQLPAFARALRRACGAAVLAGDYRRALLFTETGARALQAEELFSFRRLTLGIPMRRQSTRRNSECSGGEPAACSDHEAYADNISGRIILPVAADASASAASTAAAWQKNQAARHMSFRTEYASVMVGFQVRRILLLVWLRCQWLESGEEVDAKAKGDDGSNSGSSNTKIDSIEKSLAVLRAIAADAAKVQSHVSVVRHGNTDTNDNTNNNDDLIFVLPCPVAERRERVTLLSTSGSTVSLTSGTMPAHTSTRNASSRVSESSALPSASSSSIINSKAYALIKGRAIRSDNAENTTRTKNSGAISHQQEKEKEKEKQGSPSSAISYSQTLTALVEALDALHRQCNPGPAAAGGNDNNEDCALAEDDEIMLLSVRRRAAVLESVLTCIAGQSSVLGISDRPLLMMLQRIRYAGLHPHIATAPLAAKLNTEKR